MQPETIADRYRVLRAIGRGGMGTVWLCRDGVLSREVAVKQMGALPGEDVRSTTRAMREARVSAAMNHENAVAVFDVVDHDGGTWLVMEYFPSQTLADLIAAEGALPPERVAKIGVQVASALASAHGLGIVHRDVKPGNVLVGQDDAAKISDFGIARGHTDMSLTQTGMMTGTPGYFSPELARGGDPSFASDAWAFGATLFTAVEGEPPYPTQSNPLAILSTITREPPAQPKRAGPLAPVIAGLMQHDPDKRWSMERVRRELSTIASGPRSPTDHTRAMPVAAPAVVPPPTEDESFTSRWETTSTPMAVEDDRPPRRIAWWVVAAVALLVLGIGAAAWSAFAPDDSPNSDDSTATQRKEQSNSPVAGSPSESATGPTSSEPTASDSTTGATTSVAGHSPAAAENFVSSYYTLVPGDTDAGWAQLSPSFQGQTGRESYDDFWASISSVSVSDVHAVSPTMVDYTISYDGSAPEAKRITLVTDGSSYLIDGDGQQG
jgi:serine/threonine protein kinase